MAQGLLLVRRLDADPAGTPEIAPIPHDDFIGQGGTLANLIGYVEAAGGHALGATVLTGKPYSAKVSPDRAQIEALRSKHGRDLENWWRERFGFGFDCLTRSEARYLENSPDAQAIRDRLVEAGLEGGSGSSSGGPEPLVSRRQLTTAVVGSPPWTAWWLQCQIECQKWVFQGV